MLVMKKKLMILGSMDEFVTLVDKANERGIETFVCDGYSDGPAKVNAHKSFDVDVRNTDEIADICIRENIDAIVTSFSDLLAECLVSIADKANLPCYAKPEKFKFLREKTLMKRMFSEIGVRTAQSTIVHRATIAEDIEEIGFPCVMKPANGYGSHGIYIAYSVEDIEELFDKTVGYSSFDYILAERMYSGYEFNMMNWIVDGEVVTISVADRETSSYDRHVIPHVSRCVYPSKLTADVVDEARDIVKRIADYVEISNGPLSIQFFYSEDTGIMVCEAAGRLFGYEHELVTYASGLSIEDVLLNYAYDHEGLKRMLHNHKLDFDYCSCGLYFHGREGTVANTDSIIPLGKIPCVKDVSSYYVPGDVITHSSGSKPYVVRFYLKAATHQELDEATKRIFRDIHILDQNGCDLLYPNQFSNR